MSIQFFVPGLLWPGLQTRSPCQGLALPALEAMLAVGRWQLASRCNPDSALLELFGLPADAAIAPWRRQAEPGAGAAPDHRWLCADPVGLRFVREHLLLCDAAELAITEDEARRLVDGLNESFADLGSFEMGTPQRWYLLPASLPPARFTPLADAVGRPVAHFMPEGDGARAWNRVINEIQVWLHDHPVNRGREAAGQPTIDSLWPWGAGAPATRPSMRADALVADGVLARGLGAAAGVRRIEAGRLDPGLCRESLLVYLEGPRQSAERMDLDGWQRALAALDRDWLAPALAALRRGELQGIEILAPGDRACLRLDLPRPRLWPFWKRPRPFQQLIEAQK